ncbi:MAG: TetR/AcrR family transcriptional regulator [Acidobacteriota bacterium]
MNPIPTRAPSWTTTSDRIYRAAISLFRRRDFSEVTIEDITSAAKTCRRTFFNHFPTKEHVLARLHQELTADCLARAEKATPHDGWERIEAAFDAFSAAVMAEPILGRSLLRLVFVSDVLASQDQQDVLILGDWLRRELHAAIAAGTLGHWIDIGTACSLLMGILSSGTTQWLISFPNTSVPLDRDFRSKLQVIRKGLEA